MKRILLICLIIFSSGNIWSQNHRLYQENETFFVFYVPTTSQKLVDFARDFKVSPKRLALINNIQTTDSVYRDRTLKLPILSTNIVQHHGNQGNHIPIVANIHDKYRLNVIQKRLQLTSSYLMHLNKVSQIDELIKTDIIIGYIPVKAKPTLSAKNESSRHSLSPSSSNRNERKDSIGRNPADQMRTNQWYDRFQESFNKILELFEPIKMEEQISSFGLIYEEEAEYGFVNQENGAGVFYKSDSNSNAIYALYNYAPVGSIVKVTNPSNGNVVYAKVIGKLPPTERYRKAIIGISGNAGPALGAKDMRLFVQTFYVQ